MVDDFAPNPEICAEFMYRELLNKRRNMVYDRIRKNLYCYNPAPHTMTIKNNSIPEELEDIGKRLKQIQDELEKQEDPNIGIIARYIGEEMTNHTYPDTIKMARHILKIVNGS